MSVVLVLSIFVRMTFIKTMD